MSAEAGDDRVKSPLGHLPKGWRINKLASITSKIGSGATPKGGQSSYLLARNRFALVRSQNVYDRRFSYENLAFITDEQADGLRHARLQSGDVLLNITGDGITFGRSCIVPDDILPACVNQHVTIIRTIKDFCVPGYLLSYLTHPITKHYIESFNAGGSRRAITKGHIESFDIPLPPLKEQHAIAHVLGSLDDKIELNWRMNQTLEAIARALFKSWFIDFDPVRAKADGRTPEGMDEVTARLFPDSFEESELGPIPHGWHVQTLPEAYEVNPYRRLAKGLNSTYLDMQGMPTVGHRPSSWVQRPFGSGMKFTNGDTLVARITPCLENGKTAYVDFLREDEVGWGSTEYIVLRPKPPLPSEHGYFLARTEDFRSFAIQNMTGTSGRQRVPSTCFSNYSFVVPSIDVANRFGLVAASQMKAISRNADQSSTLILIRDSLLPRLLSGELRIKDAERFVEATL